MEIEQYKEILSKLNQKKPETFKWHDVFINFQDKLCAERDKLVEAGFIVDLKINDIINEIIYDETHCGKLCGTEAEPMEYIYLCIDHPALNLYISISIGLCDASQSYPAMFVKFYNRFVKSEYSYNITYKIENGKWSIVGVLNDFIAIHRFNYLNSDDLINNVLLGVLYGTC